MKLVLRESKILRRTTFSCCTEIYFRKRKSRHRKQKSILRKENPSSSLMHFINCIKELIVEVRDA